ncbi:MAG: TetR/AcrR family transcriptional regulator [Anaerovoracaceae bacterium]
MSKSYKREQLIKAAFRLFTEKGYVDTRIADIAKSCGMGKATFYDYFSSKEALFEEVFRNHVEEAYAPLPNIIAGKNTCKERLDAFVNFEFQLALKFGIHKNTIDHLLTKMTSMQNHSLETAMRKFFVTRYGLVLHIIREGMENGEIKKADPILATSMFLGAYSLYSSFHYGLLGKPRDYAEDLASSDGAKAFSIPYIHDNCTFPPPMDDFFNLIFSGLGNDSPQTI